MEQAVRVVSAKRDRIEHKLVDSAREHLHDEQVRALFRGQTFVSPVLLPLIGSLLIVAKSRAVIVTDQSVVTVQQSFWSESTVVAMVSRHHCGSVPIEVGRWGLKIGDEPKIFALPTTLEDMSEVARLAGQPAG